MKLSVVIPVLDEAAGIGAALSALAPSRGRGVEVVVVDGGSRDATRTIAAPLADRVLSAPRGRANQMNAGARASSGDVILFLHADTRLPAHAEELILEGLAAANLEWGRFDIAIEGRSPLLAVVAAFMNVRSRLTAIATGDQALFVRRAAFDSVGGFPPIALMEDIAFSKAMKRRGRALALREKAVTSGRRWDRDGPVRTLLLMWRLRLAYFLGADPARLAERYGNARATR